MIQNRILLKLTALTPVAHGSAASSAVGPNNTQLFNRQLQRLPRQTEGATREMAEKGITSVLSLFQISSQTDFLRSLSGDVLLACLFASNVPLIYRGEGEGLFTGVERYQVLATRLSDACRSCNTLSSVWHSLAIRLKLPMFAAHHFERMSAFFSLPKSLQVKTIDATLKNLELIIMAARLVAETDKIPQKKQEGIYRATTEQIRDLCRGRQEAVVISVPAISGNALRHCLLREPGANRLLQELALSPNIETIPIGVTRFLYGGGQVQARSKAPSGSDLLESLARCRYPLIDALGGCFDYGLMSAARCKLSAWILCRENNEATEAIAKEISNVSIFDYLEDIARTRVGVGGNSKESGQMVFNFETLAVGLPVIVEISFAPFTSDLVKAAISQAILDFNDTGIVGSRSVTGFSRFHIESVEGNRDPQPYLSYLQENREELKNGLLSGEFCTGKVLCAA